MEEMPVPNRTNLLEQVCKERLTQVFSAEAVVPDTMPDAASVLFADAQVFIRSASLADGAATLEGTITGTVVYLPEGTVAPEKMNFTVPVSMSARNERIEDDCRLLFSAAVIGAEARAVNSRKLSFRSEICADMTVYRRSGIDLSVDTEALPALETLPGEAELGYITQIGEKTFTVADDLDLSAPIAQLLWYQTQFLPETARRVGGKTILQGVAELQLLYLPPDSDKPCYECRHVPFSQLIDADGDDETIAYVEFHPASCFVEIVPGLNRSEAISFEAQLTAQILYTAEKKLSYISDAYSLRCPVIIKRDRLEACGPFSAVSRKTTVREQLKLPEEPIEILSVQIAMTPCTVTDEAVKATAGVCILYRTETALRALMKKLPVEFPPDETGECLFAKAVCPENFAAIQHDAVLLQFDVELTSLSAQKKTVDYVSAMEAAESVPADAGDRPSIVAVRAGDRSLWDLAKSYHSTVALIRAANREDQPADSLLLIPRGR